MSVNADLRDTRYPRQSMITLLLILVGKIAFALVGKIAFALVR